MFLQCTGFRSSGNDIFWPGADTLSARQYSTQKVALAWYIRTGCTIDFHTVRAFFYSSAPLCLGKSWREQTAAQRKYEKEFNKKFQTFVKAQFSDRIYRSPRRVQISESRPTNARTGYRDKSEKVALEGRSKLLSSTKSPYAVRLDTASTFTLYKDEVSIP